MALPTGMNGIGSLIPGADKNNPMQLMMMISHMAQSDPDGLARLMASKGMPVPQTPAGNAGAPSLGQMVAGQNPSAGMPQAPQAPTPPTPTPAPVDTGTPAVGFEPAPPTAPIESAPIEPLPGTGGYGMSKPMGDAAPAGDANGGSQAAKLAQVLSMIKAPETPQQPPPLAAPGIPSRGPVNSDLNPQNLQNLIQLLIGRSQQGPVQKPLGSLIAGM